MKTTSNHPRLIKNEKNNDFAQFYYNNKGEKTSALFTKLDEDGKVVLKIWKDFDTLGRTTHIKASNGYEEWVDFDKKSQKTVKKMFPDGRITIVKFDKKGREILENLEEEKPVTKENNKNQFSITAVIQYCSLAIIVFIATTLLWEQIDIAQFGASLPSSADTISSGLLTFAALIALYFKNKIKK